MKKVLMICYFFPPCGGGGVQRSSKFAKYLPECNWRPYILTVRKRNLVHDFSLLKDIHDNTKIFETFSLEEVFIKEKKEIFSASDIGRSAQKGKFNSGRGILTLLKGLVNNFVFQPDSAMLWLPFAVFAGIRIIKRCDIDLIYATGGPWTDLVIGGLLKRFTRIPLVIDLRDPWSISENNKPLDKYFEAFTFRLANAIILNTENMKEAYCNIYPKFNEKMYVITNGYDNEDFINTKPVKRDKNKFRVVLSGDFQSPDTFYEALSGLLKERPEIKNKLEIQFVGFLQDTSLSYHDVKQVVNIISYKPHNELISYLLGADLLLIIKQPGMDMMLVTPGKVYEYFAAKKPILAIVPKGNSLFELIRKTKTGSAVDFFDVEEIKRQLLKYCEKDFDYRPNLQLISQFERKLLTKRLAKLFESVAKAYVTQN